MHIDRITIIPDVCGGEPTIRGMRITASQVLEMLAGGGGEKGTRTFTSWFSHLLTRL